MNLPTWITVSRLLALPLLFLLLQTPTNFHRWLGVIIFLVASLTDWLDGYLARKFNQVTELGKFLDPLVDKFLVLAPLLILVELQRIPAWGVFLILGRELAIAGWRVNPNLTGNSEIKGANMWGKSKTASQIIAIACLIAPIPSDYQILILILFWLSVLLTIVSGIIYLWPTFPTIEAVECKE